MLLLGIDLETNCADVESPDMAIIEIGAVIWDTCRRTPVAMMNHMISDTVEELDDVITELTGITLNMLKEFGIPIREAMEQFIDMTEQCEFYVAHNGNKFDRPIIENTLEQLELCQDAPDNKLWIDTMIDVPYACKTRKLTYLATEHGFLNPFPHRALFDVCAMFNVLDNYDIHEVVAIANTPMITLQALVGFPEKDLAKERGFMWDGNKKVWHKSGRDYFLSKEVYPFDTRRITL